MHKSRIKKRNGFTLVELIVVIAIIGILSAILVPSYMFFVEKANFSSDTADARNMTELLKMYKIQNGVRTLDAAEIRAVVNLHQEEPYSFIPRNKKWNFWYNTDSEKIEVKTVGEVGFNLNAGSVFFTSFSAAVDPALTGDTPEEIMIGFYLLDRGGSDLADAVNMIRNAESILNFNDAKTKYPDLGAHFEKFNPATTLYVNNSVVYTESTSLTEYKVTKVIFADGLYNVPSFDEKINFVKSAVDPTPINIDLPTTVKTIEKGAFQQVLTPSMIIAPKGVIYEEGFTLNAVMDDVQAQPETRPFVVKPVKVLYDGVQVNPGAAPANASGGKLADNKFFKIDFEDLNQQSTSQSIDIAVPTGRQDYIYAFVVSLYNENGLFARTTVYYNPQEAPSHQ